MRRRSTAVSLAIACAACGPDKPKVIDARPVDAPRIADAISFDAATAPACPTWTHPPAAQHGWMYVLARDEHGIDIAASEITAYVRRTKNAADGEHADPDAPCTVGSYPTDLSKVFFDIVVPGFSSATFELRASDCAQTAPCVVTLRRALSNASFLVAADRRSVRLKRIDEVPALDQPAFRVAIASDAVVQANTAGHALKVDLDRYAKATRTDPAQLAVELASAKLDRHCTAALCADDPKLDPALQAYLKPPPPPR